MAELRTLPRQWDELVDAHGSPRPAAAALVERLRSLDISELQERQTLAEVDILALGITFTVYHDGQGTDRAWPMDIVPRVIAASEWTTIERGLKQRLSALNRFIDDVYHERRVVADGIFPAE
ncbi:MAG: circularly permuted type 2 ATP-grasp protein, partial [Ilumatobacteraceae bacterium]